LSENEPAKLEQRINYSFKNRKLLEMALVHASAREGKAVAEDNERLEFLGDRVLGLAIAELLYENFPRASEGELARRFNRLVRKQSCALIAGEMGLGECLRLSRSEHSSGGAANVNILGDACEALLGAVFLDGGYERARRLIRKFWKPLLLDEGEIPVDPKTALQEWAQGQQRQLPRYQVVSRDGPDHQPLFTIEVAVKGIAPARGQGNSKRDAERQAAVALLMREGVWKENKTYE